ncbi:MAG TPA: DinB family protein [Anaerolineae bacterium]|nr:DinB family protein [Anaerolineae bacterium]
MTHAERKRKIEAYGAAYQMLIEALGEFPKAMWRFKPSPDDWSIQELIIHLADSEANSFIRCRRLYAEPGTAVLAYNEVQWAKALDYEHQSTDDALELFKWLRLASHKLIQTWPESAWANTIEHPENGVMTADDWLDVYARHIPEHVEQMRRNYREWQRRGQPV